MSQFATSKDYTAKGKNLILNKNMSKKIEKQATEGYKSLKEDISCIIEKAKLQTHKAVGNIIIQALLESGHSFAFAGRQRKIIIDGQIQTIDMEFYNRELQCIILVGLKTEKFKADFVGQMNKYISYYRENIQLPFEKDTIGLIICAEKGKEEVHYALAGMDNRIFVVEYKTKLPSEEEIKNKIEEVL